MLLLRLSGLPQLKKEREFSDHFLTEKANCYPLNNRCESRTAGTVGIIYKLNNMGKNSGLVNAPSTTGNPSGGGRGNK